MKLQPMNGKLTPYWMYPKPARVQNININMAKRGTQCCAYGCKKRRKFGSEIIRSDSDGSEDDETAIKRQNPRTFHGFPADPDRQKKWVDHIHRDNWVPTQYSKICSDHFLEKFIDRTGQIVRLRDNAVPTRFKGLPRNLKKITSRHSPIKKNSVPMAKGEKASHSTGNITSYSSHDHPYYTTESPRKLKKKLNSSLDHIASLKKKLKHTRQKSLRLSRKVKSLKGLLQTLRQKHLISASCEELLKQTFSGVSLAVITRAASKTKCGKGLKYSKELRSFALTLQFYSSKAYEFVRKVFNFNLPHPAHIRKWYNKIPAEPGFTKPAFESIRRKVSAAEQKGSCVICAVMLDEMAIKRHVAWDGERYRGYVDIGNGVVDDSLPEARDALVLMAVCINGSWKVPLAYFLVNGLSGAERANIVKSCITRLSETGAKVVSLTCDGPSCHFSMLQELGASISIPDMKAYFKNPHYPEQKVYVLLDACHMLKLIRNTLGDVGILLDNNGSRISWQYILDLQKLQEKEGLRLANKLRLPHIKWHQQKMKVNIAAQTLSSSVADAIEYCNKKLLLKQFEGSEATVHFIRTFDRLFDLLNSRNPFSKGFKSPLRIANKHYWEPFVNDAINYITGLKTSAGVPMYNSRRKTAFLGFIACMQSVQGLFHELVEKEPPKLQYLLTYKLSQDHIELFFSAIRSAGGCNNNPTSQQFIAAYKRLLLRSSIGNDTGNCQKQDTTDFLDMIGDTCKINDESISLSAITLKRKYGLDGRPSEESEHDYAEVPDVVGISHFKSAAIAYIAGYVAVMANKQLLCEKCSLALGGRNNKSCHGFIDFKDHGRLLKPSPSVVKICEETESRFMRMLSSLKGHLPKQGGLPNAIAISVLEDINVTKVFPELQDHMYDTSVGDNHVFQLITLVSKCYSKIRFYHLGKETTIRLTGDNIRKKLHKIVLFKHQ